MHIILLTVLHASLLYIELMASDRVSKREILSLEDDLPSWRTVLDTPVTSGIL